MWVGGPGVGEAETQDGRKVIREQNSDTHEVRMTSSQVYTAKRAV